jgi:hypothetical protein
MLAFLRCDSVSQNLVRYWSIIAADLGLFLKLLDWVTFWAQIIIDFAWFLVADKKNQKKISKMLDVGATFGMFGVSQCD